jgi:hypothetical protein
MKARMLRHLALESLRVPGKLKDLAEYQVAKLNAEFEQSRHSLALAVQQCYRHIFYPTRIRVDGCQSEIGHTAIDIQTASDRPGDGQKQVITQLQNISKLRLPTDQPDSPVFVRDRTPLKKGQITTAALRNEFLQDTSLPMLVGNEVFIKGIRLGLDLGDYVYQSGDMVRGKGDPHCEIKVNEQSFVYTASYASDHAIWPVAAPQPVVHPDKPPYTPPTPTPPPDVNTSVTVQAEDVLKAALTRIFNQVRHNGGLSLDSMIIRPFDKGDALKLIPLVKSVSNASKRMDLNASFETKAKSMVTIDFKGDLDDAAPLKDFLELQFRAASDSDASISFFLHFDPPLAVEGNGADALIQRLTRLVSPSAHVQATVTAKKPENHRP